MPINFFHSNIEEARNRLLKVTDGNYKNDLEKEKLISEAIHIITQHKDRSVNYEHEDQSSFQNLLDDVHAYEEQLDEALELLQQEDPDTYSATLRLIDSHRILKMILVECDRIIKVLKQEEKELD